MCAKACLSCLFTSVLVASTATLIFALLTPGWVTFQGQMNNSTAGDTFMITRIINRGIFMKHCLDDMEACSYGVWKEMERHEKSTCVLLLASAALCVITVSYSCLSGCSCCCEHSLALPVPLLCFAALFLDLAAISIYIFDGEGVSKAAINMGRVDQLTDLKHVFGYSVYLSVVAGLGLLADVIMGMVLLRLSR